MADLADKTASFPACSLFPRTALDIPEIRPVKYGLSRTNILESLS
jgi:hypothetical protein